MLTEQASPAKLPSGEDADSLKHAIDAAIAAAEQKLSSQEIGSIIAERMHSSHLLDQLFGRPALS